MRTLRILLVALAVLLAACGGTDVVPEGPGSTTDVDSPAATFEPTEPTDDGTSPQAACGTYEPESQVTDEAVLVVSEPAEDSEFPPDSTVAGCTNAFEAAFQWELLDADGEVLASGNETASCGSGCLGTFAFTVDYEVDSAQEGSLRLFVESAEDGSVQMENHVLVQLVPA